MSESTRTVLSGPALVLGGDDIDTDRIMPARFLRAITFEGIEAHVFEDDRRALASRGETHPFDDPGRRHARIMIVGSNFGCGSSREHAPQAISRWGIRAIVGRSFAEIFFGNSVAIGLACVSVAPDDLARLRRAAADPSATVAVDLPARTVSAPGLSVKLDMPESGRRALISGEWDATSLLLQHYEDVERVTRALPYTHAFR
jgi:3-isopropylmalate/(R)-2-methylmalate dehydratase small subunit